MSEDRKAQASLYGKMAQAMRSIARIPKRGHNDYFNYDFVLDADVLDAVRRAMAEVDLALFVSLDSHERHENRTIAAFTLTFADGDTGATQIVHWSGEAADKGDKGLSKAATSAVKYCLLKTFLISTGDEDPDASGETDVADTGAKNLPRQQRQPAPRQQEQDNGDAWRTKWSAFVQKALGELEYNHMNHVINTLRQKWDQDEAMWNPDGTLTLDAEEMWAHLKTHQEAKE